MIQDLQAVHWTKLGPKGSIGPWKGNKWVGRKPGHLGQVEPRKFSREAEAWQI
jgi:hypothetical protein